MFLLAVFWVNEWMNPSSYLPQNEVGVKLSTAPYMHDLGYMKCWKEKGEDNPWVNYEMHCAIFNFSPNASSSND